MVKWHSAMSNVMLRTWSVCVTLRSFLKILLIKFNINNALYILHFVMWVGRCVWRHVNIIWKGCFFYRRTVQVLYAAQQASIHGGKFVTTSVIRLNTIRNKVYFLQDGSHSWKSVKIKFLFYFHSQILICVFKYFIICINQMWWRCELWFNGKLIIGFQSILY
jgi:hypothetical protein